MLGPFYLTSLHPLDPMLNSYRLIFKFFFFLTICTSTIFSHSNSLYAQVITFPNHQSISLPNFNHGLVRGGKSKATYIRHLENRTKNSSQADKNQHHIEKLKQLYSQFVSTIIFSAASETPAELHIPRIVHQIWLGSPVPEKYKKWMTTWMNWHGWEYKLWTDKDVKELHLINQDIYDKVSNYGQKSDILRMELLYMMGGIYVDTDFECRNSEFFEILHHHVDFYAGIEPLEHSFLRINNAIIGCASGHPLMEKMIHELPQHFEANKKKWALVSTGPVFMTKVIYAYLEQEHPEINVLLPCSLVYPYTSAEVDRSPSSESLVPMKETAAIHYWSKSWVK